MERKLVLMAVRVSMFGALIAMWLLTPANAIIFPGTGIRINIRLGPSIQYATTLDYFYVRHGWSESDWSLQNETYKSWFLSPANYFTLETNATNFQHPPLQEWVGFDEAIDTFYKLFWFQFQPGDLDPGAYSFTGTYYLDYNIQHIFTITLIITQPSIAATIDIDPDTLNLKSNGEWITAYIELPEDYSANDIDVNSILLEDTISVDVESPITVGDHDLDNIPDLMVKFDRATIIEWLNANDYSEDTGKYYEISLTITGTAAGTQFTGTDKIKVLQK